MDSGHPVPRATRWKTLLTLATFIALAILIYSLRGEIADVIKNLGQVNAFALLLIIPLKFVNFDAYARLYRGLFKTMGHPVTYWPMYRLSLELSFVNYIFPSGGVSGVSYFAARARSLGISAAKGTLAQIAKWQLLFVSYQPLLIIGIILLAARDHANNLVLITTSSLITMLVIFTLIGLY
ncbi:flippase-like domain-containing protein, partial [Candidatus Saccharibacteria bacterium]|nr:flippase-like domain-containing protein [Candidatus Saccharibacteria bacterium]